MLGAIVAINVAVLWVVLLCIITVRVAGWVEDKFSIDVAAVAAVFVLLNGVVVGAAVVGTIIGALA